MFIHPDDTHTIEPSRVVDERALAFGQDSGIGGSSGTRLGPGRCAPPSHDERPARQRPAHRRTREHGTRIGRLTHILAPHVSTLWAPVAAHTHGHNRGAPPTGLTRQAPDHRATTNALAPAASAPPILTSNTARPHCMIWLNALTRHLQPQAIQARERAQIRAIKDSIGHVEVFRMDGVGISIIGRPRPPPGHHTPIPANNTYTLKCEEPDFVVSGAVRWRAGGSVIGCSSPDLPVGLVHVSG